MKARKDWAQRVLTKYERLGNDLSFQPRGVVNGLPMRRVRNCSKGQTDDRTETEQPGPGTSAVHTERFPGAQVRNGCTNGFIRGRLETGFLH